MIINDRYYKLLINNLPGMLYRCRNDANWTMEFVSKGCKKLTGYSPDSLLFNKIISYADLIHPEDRDHVSREVALAIQENRYWTIEYRIFSCHETIKWVWEQGKLCEDAENQWLEGFITDISDSKDRETQLKNEIQDRGRKVKISRELLNQYKKAVDVSSIVSKTDPFGNITYVNKEFCKISGYKKHELLGQNHNLVRSKLTPQELFKDLWKTIQNKKIWQGVIQNTRKDGKDYFVSSTIVPLLDENGNIQEFMSIRNDVTDLVTKEQTILKQTTDAITGLPNRIKLLETIFNSYKDIHLAIVNSPRLREISDFYDLETAQKVSQNIATQLKKLTDASVEIFSLSQGEFALVKRDNTNIDPFLQLCHRVIHYFDYNDTQVDDLFLHTPMVIGLASHKNKLLTHAEMALHKALSSNQEIVYFNKTQDIATSYESNLKWTREVKEAIKEDRIEVFAQPIVHNQNQGIQKYECLIRMIGKNGEIISPYHFLEIAKKARLYPTLTQIVIEKAFKHFSQTNDEFSINFAMADIFHPETVGFLKAKLLEFNLGKQLIIEVVESEGIENFDAFTDFIHDMKSLGCRIAIDDFGTGYSNFEYLMKLNADLVKIDGSLIKNIDTDEPSLTITKLIVEFAQKLNMKVIAEFVHNEAVLEQIKALQIDYSQGFYLGEPIPINTLKKTIEVEHLKATRASIS